MRPLRRVAGGPVEWEHVRGVRTAAGVVAFSGGAVLWEGLGCRAARTWYRPPLRGHGARVQTDSNRVMGVAVRLHSAPGYVWLHVLLRPIGADEFAW